LVGWAKGNYATFGTVMHRAAWRGRRVASIPLMDVDNRDFCTLQWDVESKQITSTLDPATRNSTTVGNVGNVDGNLKGVN